VSQPKRDRSEITLLGTGKSMDQGKGMNTVDMEILNAHRAAGVLVLGSPGSGKTRLAENMIEQDIRDGRSVLFMDPKIDQAIASKIVQAALACDRLEDLMFINTVFPEDSVQINPMSYYFIHEELVEHCVAGIKEGKDPFYRNIAKEVVSAAITGLSIIAKEQGKSDKDNVAPSRLQLNLLDIKNRMSREELEELRQELSGITSQEALEAENDLTRIVATGQEYYSKVASSLRVALMELTTGNIGRIVGRADENRFLEKLEQGRPVIMVCQLGSNIVHDAGFTLGKVILSMVQSFIGRVYSSNRKTITPPLCIHIDESPSVLNPNVETLLAMSRGADCWVTLYAQSMNQFFDKLGPDCAKALLSNINTKVFMRATDAETADYVASHFGTIKKLSPVIAPGGQITTREVEEDVVKAFDVLSLRPREFFMLSYADTHSKGRWKGRTGNTSPSWLEIIYPDAPAY